MLRFSVSLMAVLLTSGVYAETEMKCVKDKIKVETFGETKITREKFCYEPEMANFSSENCQKKKCKAYQHAKRYYIWEFFGPYGSPGFKLCREIGGTPEIVEFFAEAEWHRTDRCVFSDGFVDTDTLLEYYIDRDEEKPEEK